MPKTATISRLVLEKAEQTIYTLSQGKDVRALEHISKSASDGFDRLRKLAGPDRDKNTGAYLPDTDFWTQNSAKWARATL